MPEKKTIGSNFLEADELTVTQVAAERGLSTSTVRAWVNQELIPARRNGRRWLLRRSDVEQFLLSNPEYGSPHASPQQAEALLGSEHRPPEREATRRPTTGTHSSGTAAPSGPQGLEPMVPKHLVKETSRTADLLWDAAVRAFDPFPDRLRVLAVSAERLARVIRLAELANVPWQPTENARDITLASGLEPDGGREGPPSLWDEFDTNLRALGEAMATDQNRLVYAAYEALSQSAITIADALDPPQSETPSREQAQAS